MVTNFYSFHGYGSWKKNYLPTSAAFLNELNPRGWVFLQDFNIRATDSRQYEFVGYLRTGFNSTEVKSYLRDYFLTYFTGLNLTVGADKKSPVAQLGQHSTLKPKSPVIITEKEVPQIINTTNTDTNTNTTPNNTKSWFDKTFFDGAGALTGAGIAIIIVGGAIILRK